MGEDGGEVEGDETLTGRKPGIKVLQGKTCAAKRRAPSLGSRSERHASTPRVLETEDYEHVLKGLRKAGWEKVEGLIKQGTPKSAFG